MTWRLLRREPLWIIAFAAAIGAAYGAIAPADGALPMVTGMGPLLLLFAAPNRRTTLFEAALPIPARSLFTARLLFVLAVVWAPVAAVSARRGPPILGAGVVLSAAAVFIMTTRVELFGAPHNWAIGLAAAAACVGLALEAGGHNVAVGAVCAVAAAVRLGVVWPRIPGSFQVAPYEPWQRRARPTSALSRRTRFAFSAVFWSMLWGPALMLAIVVFQVAIGMWTYGIIAGCGVPTSIRRSTRWLWGLPVSRRTLLGISVGPLLLAVIGGIAIGAWLRPIAELRYPLAADAGSAAPVESWRFARGASAPAIRAPWGETANPIAMRMPGFVVYDPFTAPAGSSRAFVEWQFARATEAIYGRPVTEEEYRRYRKELRPLSLQPRGAVVIGAVVLTLALFCTFCLGAAEWGPVARLAKPRRQAVTTSAALLAFAPIAAVDIRMAFPGTSLTSVAFLNAAALRLSAALPEGPWAVAAFATAAVAFGWLLVERQFTTIEPGRVVETVYDRLKT